MSNESDEIRALRADHARLQSELANSAQTIMEGNAAFNMLENRLATTETQLASNKKPVAKVNPPTIFTGLTSGTKTLDVRHWILQVDLALRSQPTTYSTDEEQINYAISFLRDDAFTWVYSYLQNKDSIPTWLSTYAGFCSEIQSVYGDPDVVQSYARKLEHLRQTGSAASYAAEFRTYAHYLDWNEAALMYQFKKSLKVEVKTELYKNDQSQTLNELVALACSIDNNLHALRLDLRFSSKSQSSPQPNQPKSTRGGYHTPTMTSSNDQSVPMQVDATRNSTSKRGPLTQKQKDYRKTNNLCMYCGLAGHLWADCTLRRPSEPLRVNVTSNEPREAPLPKADEDDCYLDSGNA